jgi:hypothetical protein
MSKFLSYNLSSRDLEGNIGRNTGAERGRILPLFCKCLLTLSLPIICNYNFAGRIITVNCVDIFTNTASYSSKVSQKCIYIYIYIYMFLVLITSCKLQMSCTVKLKILE